MKICVVTLGSRLDARRAADDGPAACSSDHRGLRDVGARTRRWPPRPSAAARASARRRSAAPGSRGGALGLRESRRAGSRATRSTAAGGTAPGSRSRCRCRCASRWRFRPSRSALRMTNWLKMWRRPARLDRQHDAVRRARPRGTAARSAPRSRRRASVQRARCGAFTRRTAACSASSRKLPPTSVVVVLRLHAVVAQSRARAGQRRVVGRDQAGVAEGAEVLAREEREAAERADAADRPRPCRSAPMACAASSMTGMPGARRLVQDRVQVGAQAEQVHRQDRLRPRRDRRASTAAGSMLKVTGSMSTSTGRAPSADDRRRPWRRTNRSR